MTSIAHHIAAALKLIYPKSATPTQLAMYVGCSRKTAGRLLYNAHAAKTCHIVGWCAEYQGIRHSWVPQYVSGKGKDVQKPAPLSSQEKLRQRKARKFHEAEIPDGASMLNALIVAWSKPRRVS